jgi:fatty acid desaturase
MFGEDKQNPPEQAVPELENTTYYRVITYLLVPIITFGFLFNVIFLATHDLHWLHWLAVAITTGSLLGFGLNLGHEMGHKKRKFDKALALFTLSLGGYGHFSIEHNRGHHRDVGPHQKTRPLHAWVNTFMNSCCVKFPVPSNAPGSLKVNALNARAKAGGMWAMKCCKLAQ